MLPTPSRLVAISSVSFVRSVWSVWFLSERNDPGEPNQPDHLAPHHVRYVKRGLVLCQEFPVPHFPVLRTPSDHPERQARRNRCASGFCSWLRKILHDFLQKMAGFLITRGD